MGEETIIPAAPGYELIRCELLDDNEAEGGDSVRVERSAIVSWRHKHSENAPPSVYPNTIEEQLGLKLHVSMGLKFRAHDCYAIRLPDGRVQAYYHDCEEVKGIYPDEQAFIEHTRHVWMHEDKTAQRKSAFADLGEAIGKIPQGFACQEFRWLPKALKDRLITVMARISEASYRRGVQQGYEIPQRRPLTIEPIADWRYGEPLDHSPWIDSYHTEMSLDRLKIEYGSDLNELGFDTLGEVGRPWDRREKGKANA